MFDLIIKNKKWYQYSGKLRKILKHLDEYIYKNKFLEVVLTNNEEIHQLNLKYRNKDKPTNVLSFNGEINIVLLAFDYIKINKDPYNIFTKNILYYLIHGILHTLGYGHETKVDWKKMKKKEESLFCDCIKIWTY